MQRLSIKQYLFLSFLSLILLYGIQVIGGWDGMRSEEGGIDSLLQNLPFLLVLFLNTIVLAILFNIIIQLPLLGLLKIKNKAKRMLADSLLSIFIQIILLVASGVLIQLIGVSEPFEVNYLAAFIPSTRIDSVILLPTLLIPGIIVAVWAGQMRWKKLTSKEVELHKIGT